MADQSDICIVGGGVVGMFCAWDHAKNGKTVRLIDKHFTGSSRHNIGEFLLHGHKESLLPFMKFSLDCWREVAEEIGVDLGFEEKGSVHFAFKEKDVIRLKEEVSTDQKHGFESSYIEDVEELKKILGVNRIPEEVIGGKVSNVDPSIDTVRAMTTLRQQIIKQGVKIWGDDEVSEFIIEEGKVKGVKTTSGEECHTEKVVICTGVWSGRLFDMVEGVKLPIRPARAHVLEVVPTSKMPSMMMERLDKYGHIVVKYTATGQALIGYSGRMDPAQATWSTEVDGPLVHWLQDRAGQMNYAVRMARIKTVKAITIAVTPDGFPYVGQVDGIEGLYCAVGFNGKSYAFAAGIARALGCIVRGENPPLDIDYLKTDVSRFGQELKAEKDDTEDHLEEGMDPAGEEAHHLLDDEEGEEEKKIDWQDPFARKG